MKDIDSENNEPPALAAKDTCCILSKDIENLMPTGRVKEEYFID